MVALGPVGGYYPEDDRCAWVLDQHGHQHKLPSYIPVKWADRIKVIVDSKGIHFMWTGWNNGEGHGKASWKGKVVYCYRHVYETVTGVKLKTLDYVDHLCERKPCLTFEHLEPVPPGINIIRGRGRRTMFKSEKTPCFWCDHKPIDFKGTGLSPHATYCPHYRRPPFPKLPECPF